MNKIKHKPLAICFLLALLGLSSQTLAATEPVIKKYTYKKSLGSLTVNPAPTDPIWELSSSILNFGELLQGQGNTLTVELKNTGAVLINSPSVSTLGDGFSAVHNCSSISTGQSCIINVTGQGLSAGADLFGTLTVSVANTSKSVTLSGSSAYYDFSLSTNTVDFGDLYVNGNGSKSITLTNTGNKPLTISSLVSSNPKITINHLCGTLLPQQSCTLTANVLSSTAGLINASSNVNSSGVSKTLGFTANFVQPDATLSPNASSSFDFGLQDFNQAKTQYYTFTNVTSLDLTNVVVTAPAVTSVVSNNCGTTLAANASCSFGVMWQPSTYGDLSGTLSVASSQITKTGTLAGKVKQSTALLQSGSLVLGNVSQYSASNTVLSFKNNGSANMTLTGLSNLPAAMSVTNNTCSNIAPAATCSMTVALNTNNVATQSQVAVTTVGAINSATLNASFNVNASNTSCLSIKNANPSLPSGTYSIDPDGDGGAAPVSVYCDMVTDGGGWTRVSSVDEALKAGTLSTITISDMGLSYTTVLMVAKSNMFTKYANENSIWWSTGVNPAIHGLKFGSSWYFLANPTAWRGYGGLNGSPYTVTLSGGVSWANSNYSTVTANPGGSYCNLNGVAQSFCGKAVKVIAPVGARLSGFNDIESLYPSTGDNQSTRALEIFVK